MAEGLHDADAVCRQCRRVAGENGVGHRRPFIPDHGPHHQASSLIGGIAVDGAVGQRKDAVTVYAVLWLMVLLMTRRRPQLLIPPARADSLLLTVDESSVMIPMLLLWNPPPLILERLPLVVVVTSDASPQLLSPAPPPAAISMVSPGWADGTRSLVRHPGQSDVGATAVKGVSTGIGLLSESQATAIITAIAKTPKNPLGSAISREFHQISSESNQGLMADD